MKFLFSLLAAIAIVALPAVPGLAEAGRELCLVCAVKEGATELETVKASRTVQGKTYGFCSENCAKEFDADPAAYLPPDLPRPVPTPPRRPAWKMPSTASSSNSNGRTGGSAGAGRSSSPCSTGTSGARPEAPGA